MNCESTCAVRVLFTEPSEAMIRPGVTGLEAFAVLNGERIGVVRVAPLPPRRLHPEGAVAVRMFRRNFEASLGADGYPGAWVVDSAGLHHDYHGRGFGIELYAQAARIVSRHGAIVVSQAHIVDGSATVMGLRVWQSRRLAAVPGICADCEVALGVACYVPQKGT